VVVCFVVFGIDLIYDFGVIVSASSKFPQNATVVDQTSSLC